MVWIIDQLDFFLRIIRYCNSICDVLKLYCYIILEVLDSVFFCEMFYFEILDVKKEKILDDFCNEYGLLRIVIVISVFGMGIYIIGINNVILYGVLKQLVEVVQENGCVGWDGNLVFVLFFYNLYYLRKVEQEVKDVYNL